MNAPLPPDAVAVAMLPVAQIAESPTNPRKRFDDTYIAELSESIKSHGLIQPITVRPHPVPGSPWPYELVVGACRLRAAELAGLEHVPGFWRELDDKQVLEIQVIENLQRRDVHEIEEAEGYDALMKHHGYRAEEIAEKIGKSRGYVYARLKLIALCQAARDEFYAGKLDASTALLVARIPGETLQKRAVKEITNGYDGQPLSYRNAKNHIRHHFTISLKQATFALDDAELVPAAGSCADCPKRSGNAPEICADLDDVDVCTDTACFDDKRLTRRQQLITNAEKKGIQIFTGEKAKEIAPYGTHSLDDEKYVDLDDIVDGDGQDRTYRDILGDKAPVVALLEIGSGERGQLVELGDPTALEKALKKAGWQRDMFKDETPETKGADAKRNAEMEARAAEQERRQALHEAERDWRKAVAEKIDAELKGNGPVEAEDLHQALLVLVELSLRREADNYEIDSDLYDRHGLALPDEFDDDEELAKIPARIANWTPGEALALLFDTLLYEDLQPEWQNEEGFKAPRGLLAAAALTGIDAEALRKLQAEEVPEPAAQAKGKGKKKAAQGAPAKASELKPADAWPFPTGSRA